MTLCWANCRQERLPSSCARLERTRPPTCSRKLSRREHLHFNATYRVQQGEHAGISGYPIFTGLNAGHEGMTLKCRTINVSNDEDEAFLSFLESDVFKAGLQLVTTAQPVIAPFSEMALGIAKTIA